MNVCDAERIRSILLGDPQMFTKLACDSTDFYFQGLSNGLRKRPQNSSQPEINMRAFEVNRSALNGSIGCK